MSSYGDPSRYIKHLHVDEQCLDLAYTREIMERCTLPVTVVKTGETPLVEGEFPENLTLGKRHLFLTRNRGRFFKPCPATKEYRCCGYHVLNMGMNCPMDCVYCILQAYLNNPWISCFVNIDDMFKELDAALAEEPEKIFRIGTGEFADSLALDSITGLSRHLVSRIAATGNAVLELKTKSVVIENLRDLDHRGRTVVAWSLNSPALIAGDEIRSAGLDERLEAAATCASWGYKLAFHFDPIVDHPGWREGYGETITKLFSVIDPENIAWISMGALRYLPALKGIAVQRFGASRMFYNEFIEGLDGKARYFRDQRLELYKHVAGEINRYLTGKTVLYFCMESDVIWKEVLGYTPEEKGGLDAMLDRSVA